MRRLTNSVIGLLLISLVTTTLLTGCDLLNPPEGGATTLSAPPPPRLTAVPTSATTDTTVKVKRINLAGSLKLRGRVVATSELPLSFRRSGWIRALNVKIGDQIEKGALLAEMEDPDLDDRIQGAKFSLEIARAALANAQLPLAPGRSIAAAEAVAGAERGVEAAWLRLAKLKAPPTEEDLVYYRAAVEKARVGVTVAQSNYDANGYKHGGEASPEARELHLATLALQVAQAQLDQVLKGPRPQDIALVESEIRTAEASLLVAKANYNYEVQMEQTLAAQREATIKRNTTEVRLREAEVERLQNRLGELQLTAPFAGTIASLDVQVGDKVSPYQNLGVLANPRELEVEASVPEEDMSWVSQGQEAQVAMDGFPAQKYKAKLRAIPSKPTLWQGKQVYQARLGFMNNASIPATIRMGADVYLGVNKSQVLVIPIAALLGDEGKRYVEVPSGSGTAKVSVVAGLATDTEVEVVSGLREGDAVVVRPAK